MARVEVHRKRAQPSRCVKFRFLAFSRFVATGARCPWGTQPEHIGHDLGDDEQGACADKAGTDWFDEDRQVSLRDQERPSAENLLSML